MVMMENYMDIQIVIGEVTKMRGKALQDMSFVLLTTFTWISKKKKKQSIVALSTCEAGYFAAMVAG